MGNVTDMLVDLRRALEEGLTGQDVPNFEDWWSNQVDQYPAKGPAGLSYFKGDVGGGKWVDCLLYRDKKGKLVGVLNHYPFDFPPHEAKGNFNVMVDPEEQGKGIGKILLKDAIKRWDVDLDAQNWTPKGHKLRMSLKPGSKKAKRVPPPPPPEDTLYVVSEVGTDQSMKVTAASPEEAMDLYRRWVNLPRGTSLEATPVLKLKLGKKMRSVSLKKTEGLTMNPDIIQKLEALRAGLDEARSKSMTFGDVPSKADFDKAFEREVPEGEYPYLLKGSDARVAQDAGVPTHGKFDSDELFNIVKKLTKAFEEGDDEAGSLASSILDTLGFEWI